MQSLLVFCSGNAKHACFLQWKCKAYLFSVAETQCMLVLVFEGVKIQSMFVFCCGNAKPAGSAVECTADLFSVVEMQSILVFSDVEIQSMFVFCGGNAKHTFPAL
jgi:hypothetical protein